MQQETMTGSLFPLLPLRVKCQNHERVPISPISPILVANVYSSCQDMDHQNSVFRWWSAKTMRGPLFPLFPLRVKCQNHERVPISSILVANVYSSCQNMDHQNRGNTDPFNVFPWWSAKSMRGSLFPLISPKGEMPKPWEGPYFPYFPYFQGLSFHLGHGPPK